MRVAREEEEINVLIIAAVEQLCLNHIQLPLAVLGPMDQEKISVAGASGFRWSLSKAKQWARLGRAEVDGNTARSS